MTLRKSKRNFRWSPEIKESEEVKKQVKEFKETKVKILGLQKDHKKEEE